MTSQQRRTQLPQMLGNETKETLLKTAVGMQGYWGFYNNFFRTGRQENYKISFSKKHFWGLVGL